MTLYKICKWLEDFRNNNISVVSGQWVQRDGGCREANQAKTMRFTAEGYEDRDSDFACSSLAEVLLHGKAREICLPVH